jgi:hypothetical protein
LSHSTATLLPLHLRKNNLVRLLARRPQGIFVSDFERGEIGPDLFRRPRFRAGTAPATCSEDQYFRNIDLWRHQTAPLLGF